MRNIRISCAALLMLVCLHAQDAAVQHAIELQKNGDFAAAAAEYRTFLASHPNEPAIHSNLGVVLAQLGRFEDAEKEYSEALRLDPANPGIQLNLALAYYKSGRIPDAAKRLSTLPPSNNSQVALLLADCYLRMGENKQAIATLLPLREKDAGNLGLAYVLGMALLRDGRVEEGQRVLDPIFRDRESAEAHFLLGSQMFFAGDYPGSAKEFAQAAAKNPNLPSLQAYYGQALLNTGDPDAATAAFRKELARDPNDFDSNLRLAQILIARNHTAEAAPLLERAALVRPGSREVEAAKNGSVGPESNWKGKPAPDFALAGTRLTSFRGKSPVLLVFGSYSCPNFRAAAPALNGLYSRYGKRIPFIMVYIREAHSNADWQSTRNEREGITIEQARTMEEKQSHATMCVRKLQLPFPSVVDGMDGKVEAAYQAWPSHAYLVDKAGIIQFSTGLTEQEFHVDRLETALMELAR